MTNKSPWAGLKNSASAAGREKIKIYPHADFVNRLADKVLKDIDAYLRGLNADMTPAAMLEMVKSTSIVLKEKFIRHLIQACLEDTHMTKEQAEKFVRDSYASCFIQL